jgi:hypothetical protein
MLLIFSIILGTLGVVFGLSSFSIFTRDKSIINLPSIFKLTRSETSLKYNFYRQLAYSIVLMIFSITLYQMSTSSFIFQLVVLLVILAIVDIYAYIQFTLL